MWPPFEVLAQIPTVKLDSPMWREPLYWGVFIFVFFAMTAGLWSAAKRKVWTRKEEAVVDEGAKEADHDRVNESALMAHLMARETSATERANAKTDEAIATLKETIVRLEGELGDVRAERDQAQVDLRVEQIAHSETRKRAENYRHQRNYLYNALKAESERLAREFGDAWTIEMDEHLNIADEASSAQHAVATTSVLPPPPKMDNK